jgi:hypothetical protein
MRKTQLRLGRAVPPDRAPASLPEGAGMDAAAEEILFSFASHDEIAQPDPPNEHAPENTAQDAPRKHD